MQKSVFLIDGITRQNIKGNLVDFVNLGAIFYENARDLTGEAFEDRINLVVTGDFFKHSGFAGDGSEYLNMLEFLFNLNIVILYEEGKVIPPEFKGKFNCFTMDFKDFTPEVLEAYVYGYAAEMKKKFEETEEEDDDLFSLIEISENIVRYKDLDYILDNFNQLMIILIDYLKLVKESQNINAKLKLREMEIEGLREGLQVADNYSKGIYELYEHNLNKYLELEQKYTKLSYLHTEDGKGVVNIENYPNRPLVVYIKEVLPLTYTNNFLATLKESINVKRQLSCKVVRLVDKSFSRQLAGVPDYYYKAISELNLRKVYSEDYILKQGNYRLILDSLLENKINLDVLIVYDSRDSEGVVVDGEGAIYLYAMRNLLPGHVYNNTIVNEKNKSMSFPHYDEFEEIKDNNTLVFNRLSNSTAITEILKTIDFIIDK